MTLPLLPESADRRSGCLPAKGLAEGKSGAGDSGAVSSSADERIDSIRRSLPGVIDYMVGGRMARAESLDWSKTRLPTSRHGENMTRTIPRAEFTIDQRRPYCDLHQGSGSGPRLLSGRAQVRLRGCGPRLADFRHAAARSRLP